MPRCTTYHRVLAYLDSQTVSPRLRLRFLPPYVAIRHREEVSAEPCFLLAAGIFSMPLSILTLGTCARPRSSLVFGFGDGLIKRAHEVEGFLRQMVILPPKDGLAAPNCLGQWHILTHSACPRFRHREGLGKEALHTARPGDAVAEGGIIFNVPECIGSTL